MFSDLSSLDTAHAGSAINSESCKYKKKFRVNTLEDIDSPYLYKNIAVKIREHFLDTGGYLRDIYKIYSVRCPKDHPQRIPAFKFMFARLNITGALRTWVVVKIPSKGEKTFRIYKKDKIIELRCPKSQKPKQRRSVKNAREDARDMENVRNILVTKVIIPSLAKRWPNKVFRYGDKTKKGIFSVVIIGPDFLHMKSASVRKIIS